MKKILLMVSLVLSATAFAKMTTQDNLNYIVTVQESSDWKHCSKLICSVAKIEGNGNKTCQKFPNIGVVSVNLTTKGLSTLQQVSSCQLVIEEEGEFEGLPKLGTSN
ncbi:MAG: hypothetical protein IPM97_02420 [Bdellovibrionaceae bacterium]|nr:hypothetical protein [Pseudobdellovibrionaceae bacterium]